MKKKLFAGLLAVAMVATMFAGCGKKKEEVQEITWMFWDDLDASTDSVTKGYKQVVDRFNKTYEGKYKVNTVTTTLDDYFTNLSSKIAADQTPDVFISDPGPRLTAVVEQGAAADLTTILKTDNKDWYDTFSGGMFEKLTYDGKIYAVPTNFAAALVFYNTEIFAKAGATVPTTFDEWIACCETIKKAGYTPISCAAGTNWCLGMIAGYLCDRAGGPANLEGVQAGTLAWTSETYVTAANKLVELSKYFQTTAATDDNDIATAAFNNGEAAMLVQGSWCIAQFDGDPEFTKKCGVFSFPALPGGSDPNRMVVKTDNLCMSSKTKSKEACIALMKMFTDDEAQKYTAEVAGKMPVTKVSFDKSKAPAQLSYVSDIVAKATGALGFYNESLKTSQCGDVFNNAMVDIVLGTCSVEEGLGKIQTFYEENIWNK